MTQMPKHPNRVRLVREQKDMSMSKLSREADVAYQYLFRIEHQQAQPSIAIGRKLANALGVTLDELFPPEDELRQSA